MAEIGRPSEYTEEIGLKICERLARGESLNTICKDDDMPARRTIHYWLLDKDKESFLHQYEKACNARADKLFDDLLDIADSENKGDVNRARLRVDTRKWYLSKVLPKKFGEKVDFTSGGEKIIPLFDYVSNRNNNGNTENKANDEKDQSDPGGNIGE